MYNQDFKTFKELVQYVDIQNIINFEEEIELVYQKESINNLNIEVNISEVFDKEQGFGYVAFSSEDSSDNKVTKYVDELKESVSTEGNYYRIIREKVKLSHIEKNETWKNFLTIMQLWLKIQSGILVSIVRFGLFRIPYTKYQSLFII